MHADRQDLNLLVGNLPDHRNVDAIVDVKSHFGIRLLDLLHNLTKRSTITSGILSTDSDFLGSFSLLLFFRSERVVGVRSSYLFCEEEEE